MTTAEHRSLGLLIVGTLCLGACSDSTGGTDETAPQTVAGTEPTAENTSTSSAAETMPSSGGGADPAGETNAAPAATAPSPGPEAPVPGSTPDGSSGPTPEQSVTETDTAANTDMGETPDVTMEGAGGSPDDPAQNDPVPPSEETVPDAEGNMPAEEDEEVEAEQPFVGTCTESQPTGTNASGSGPHDVIVETNADPGINEGTIFRPADLGGNEKYPIFVWGEGACSQDGLSNAAAMAEIASHGYFIVADGTPGGSGGRPMDRTDMEAMGAPLIAYVDWAIAENDKPCSAYYQALDTSKVSSNGFSCGGLMAQGTITDPRITVWGVTSSGMAGATQAFYDDVKTPVLFVEGGPADTAYDGGLEGYNRIAELDVPVLWFSKDIGHGGDLFQPGGGDFTKINLAWLNWWLKGDESATGKGLLVGADCPYCSDPEWEVMSANVP